MLHFTHLWFWFAICGTNIQDLNLTVDEEFEHTLAPCKILWLNNYLDQSVNIKTVVFAMEVAAKPDL